MCPIVLQGGPLFADKGKSMNMKLLSATIRDLGAVSLDYAHEQ
jgi:hypothetical protein